VQSEGTYAVSSYRRDELVAEQTLSVPDSVTPLWAAKQFDGFDEVVFTISSLLANTQTVTVTVRQNRFNSTSYIPNPQTIALEPGDEFQLSYKGAGLMWFTGEAQSASGTQDVRFIGEGICWPR
jgi:hypothetical protein